MAKAATISVLAFMAATCGASVHAQTRPLTLETVSAPPQFVSGDKVLVRVASSTTEPLRVRVNGRDTPAVFNAVKPGVRDGLVIGLRQGRNTIEVISGSTRATLSVRSHDPKAPIVSGPRIQPFICQTASFKLPDGSTMGEPLDKDCSAPTRVSYLYKAKGATALVPLADPARLPSDIDDTTTLDGVKSPFVVRLETGTLNRAIYQFAVLHNPAVDGPVGPGHAPKGWARRLLAVHGTGCPRGWYIQGAAMGVPVTDVTRLGEGFAVFNSTLNHPTNSCNPVLAAETTLRVRERVIQTLGAPIYTLTSGGSGGAYTSLQIADAFPGLFDGVISNSTFPDALVVAIQGLDGRLVNRYFREVAPAQFTPAQQQAVGGYGDASGLVGNGNQAGRTDPLSGRVDAEGYNSGVWNDTVPQAVRYDPKANPKGARATVFDGVANIYGRDPATGFALRPFDNVGVQYGLAALNAGVITPAQFLDMNLRIGGYDQDANYAPSRSVGDSGAIARAYQSGLTLSGGGGLSGLPILDYTGIYSDLRPDGDFHMKHHHFEVRERLRRWNGRTDNMVMWSGPDRPRARGVGVDVSVSSKMAAQAFVDMDAWLIAIARDEGPGSRIDKTVRNKPRTLTDGCWAEGAPGPRFIAEPQVHVGDTACNRLYPAHAQPRMVAGTPLSGDVLKCALRAPQRSDYKVQFSDEAWARLTKIFATGVCDWSKLGVGQQPVRPWSIW